MISEHARWSPINRFLNTQNLDSSERNAQYHLAEVQNPNQPTQKAYQEESTHRFVLLLDTT